MLIPDPLICLWNAVASLTFKVVSEADIDAVRVVGAISDLTFEIVTLLSVSCIPWLEWDILIFLWDVVYVGVVDTNALLIAPVSTASPVGVNVDPTVAVVPESPPVICSEVVAKSSDTNFNVSVFVPAFHVTTSAVGAPDELPVIVSPTVKSPLALVTFIVARVLDETTLLVITPPVLEPAAQLPEISLIVNILPPAFGVTAVIVPCARVVFCCNLAPTVYGSDVEFITNCNSGLNVSTASVDKLISPLFPLFKALLFNVNLLVPVVSKFARLITNFKSSYWSAVHVVAFCDLNKTPAYGCSEIVLSPVMSISPILEIQTLYSFESENRTKQCSSDWGI